MKELIEATLRMVGVQPTSRRGLKQNVDVLVRKSVIATDLTG